jgi:hypothetical protein
LHNGVATSNEVVIDLRIQASSTEATNHSTRVNMRVFLRIATTWYSETTNVMRKATGQKWNWCYIREHWRELKITGLTYIYIHTVHTHTRFITTSDNMNYHLKYVSQN